jgi:NAD(P)-dependent dehydrogenase (short-subunit alcohol dehydrogenase family)
MNNDDFIIVFGGSGGIGKAVIDCLMKRGLSRVIATYRTQLPTEISWVEWIKCDITQSGDFHGVSAAVERTKGCVRAIIYCIGIPSSKKTVLETPDGEWLSLFETNALGFIRTYSAIKEAIRCNKSRVLAFSSDASRVLGPGNGPYSASKVALESIVRTLAKEESNYGVRINALAPSVVESPLAERISKLKSLSDKDTNYSNLPWQRGIHLDEIAATAVSLVVDPWWEYVSGEIFRFSAVTGI